MKFNIVVTPKSNPAEPVLNLRLESTVTGVVELIATPEGNAFGSVLVRLSTNGMVEFPLDEQLKYLGLRKVGK